MKNVLLGGLAVLAALAFAAPASAQTFCPSGCTLTLDGNGGLAVGGGAFDMTAGVNSDGLTSGAGNVQERLSFSDSATLATGTLGIDSNQNRTNVSFDGSVYAGGASQNTIKTTGVNAGTTHSQSNVGVNGNMDYIGGGVNVTGVGTGSITFP